MTLFGVGEEPNHHIGDVQCPECWKEYPEPCRCGGLMHAASGAEEDTDGNVLLTIGAAGPRISWTRRETLWQELPAFHAVAP